MHRHLYARIEIPWAEIIAEQAKRENYEHALRGRLGMNSVQIARGAATRVTGSIGRSKSLGVANVGAGRIRSLVASLVGLAAPCILTIARASPA